MISIIGKGIYVMPTARASNASLGEILAIIGATVAIILVGMTLIVIGERYRRNRRKKSR